MAAGIFNTTRVAGEGIALAIVSAILAALAYTSLTSVVGDAAGISAARLAEGAQRLATGDMAHAISTLPEVKPGLLLAGYGDAFESLLHILTVITVLSAGAVFGFLSRTSNNDDAAFGAAEQTGV